MSFCNAKVMQIMQVTTAEGRGTDEDPMRIVTRYLDFDGNILAIRDPYMEQQPNHAEKTDNGNK